MKKDIVTWPLISMVASGIIVWWLTALKIPVNNPIIIPFGVVGFALWTSTSCYILARNIYQAKRDALPGWIRWIKTKRFWLLFFVSAIIFFVWQSFTGKNIGMIIVSSFFTIVSAGLLIKILWESLICIRKQTPPPQ